MISLNFRDGRTEKFDLFDSEELRRFNKIGGSLSSEVTGIWISNNTLPIPKGFRRVFFFGESISRNGSPEIEKVTIQMDGVRAILTNYKSMLRIDLEHKGIQRFIPHLEG